MKVVDWVDRLGRTARRWWPVVIFLVGALLTQHVLLRSSYDVRGHAAEHLDSASAPFMAAAVVAILMWATPRARCQLDVLAAAAAWFSTTVLVMVGSLRVIDDLVAAGYSYTPTDSVPDVADHALANSSIWYAVVAALVLIAAFRCRRHIGSRAAVSAALATVLFPPWIFPGAGVIVLAIVRCAAHRPERNVADFASQSEQRATAPLPRDALNTDG